MFRWKPSIHVEDDKQLYIVILYQRSLDAYETFPLPSDWHVLMIWEYRSAADRWRTGRKGASTGSKEFYVAIIVQ